ncbi:MAG TPA: hypothetical protein EYP25_09615 [Anaerolineae bacterium]|nr:hypothetical protein [Caldilineae bacterium]HID34804.1 hypothetical protein [Anaerolineae bacterium]HIQ11373.1 hypothetical protein [Caldilineales bacterium]
MLRPTDILIFWLVVAARFIIPLFISRYPLPAIVAALLIDAVDQTLFQQFTRLPLAGYQGYDKALGIYYVVIAYISTLRASVRLDPVREDRTHLFRRHGRGELWARPALHPVAAPLWRRAIDRIDALFFILLLTVLTTRYDRDRLAYQMRFATS